MNSNTLLDESKLSCREIKTLLDKGVARTVKYVYENSPFYRDKLRREGTRPDEIRRIEDLARITPTTKADFAEGSERFRCVTADRVADIVTTSGTTGEPLVYPLTTADIERLGRNEHLSFDCAGISAHDTVAVAVTLDKCFMAGLAYYEGLKSVGATAVRVGAGSPAMIIDMVKRLSATAIISVPSFLSRIASYATENGIDLAGLPVCRLICIGEPVRTAEFDLNVLGERIRDAWGAKVYSTYGATELAGSLCECDEGRGGHMHPSLVHVEILDEDSRPVPDGAHGEVVITTIGVEAMPLVRFRTGDVSFLVRDKCACGLETPRIGPILCRRNEMLKVKGTTVFPAAIHNVLNSIPAVADYVLVATTTASLSDHVEVVVSLSSTANCSREEIAERLKGSLKVTPAVRIARHGEVAALRGDDGGRKKRLFVDRRTPAL